MLVEILYSPDGKAIGWSMKGDSPEEIKKLGTIRDLQFWGFDDTAIDYAGRKNSDDENNDPGTLMWRQRKDIYK